MLRCVTAFEIDTFVSSERTRSHSAPNAGTARFQNGFAGFHAKCGPGQMVNGTEVDGTVLLTVCSNVPQFVRFKFETIAPRIGEEVSVALAKKFRKICLLYTSDAADDLLCVD